jgi:hypothetical protein
MLAVIKLFAEGLRLYHEAMPVVMRLAEAKLV